MAGPFASNSGDKVEEVFGNFRVRRNALIQALTEGIPCFLLLISCLFSSSPASSSIHFNCISFSFSVSIVNIGFSSADFDRLYGLCDPKRENLWLYGDAYGRWRLEAPAGEVPTELPEPLLGINAYRDSMPKEEWRSWVASHSQIWLVSVAFSMASRLGFHDAQTRRLYDMTLQLPTVAEAVAAEINKKRPQQQKRKRNSSASMQRSHDRGENSKDIKGKAKEEDEIQVEWVCCYRCQRRFHRKIVRMFTATPHVDINHFKCILCGIPY